MRETGQTKIERNPEHIHQADDLMKEPRRHDGGAQGT
jgi:hypothetical protein